MLGIQALALRTTSCRKYSTVFIQADSSATRKYGGSGLGLAISKGFVEMLGGQMWADSDIGQGSCFYFTLPYVKGRKAHVVEKVERQKPVEEYNWSNRHILIAEDDKFSFKFLENYLRRTNVNIMHAETGRQAVELCMANPNIDLVLMDIQMPEMNGYEATTEIKKHCAQLPIIAQTANAIAEEKDKCFDAGCDDFVTKPINMKELFVKINKFLVTKEVVTG
ncbi:MAG: response regulator [Bacteroidales bacterium]|nr:response regulator [Bacteroidales bacterium]